MKPTDRLHSARTGLEALLRDGALNRCRQHVRDDVRAAVDHIRTAHIALTTPRSLAVEVALWIAAFALVGVSVTAGWFFRGAWG